MLWEKQTNGIYVNLCQEDLKEKIFEKAKSLYVYQSAPKKSNIESLKHRKLGNILFGTERWLDAIKSYNLSLCFAENGSEYRGLAFGNRSACFLHLKMYDACLADIELAIEAYFPVWLLPKLEKRRADCLKQIRCGDGRSAASERELSFEETPLYPGLANVLQIQQSEKFGRHITATSDVAVGKILIMEKAFVSKSDGKRNRCDTCWKKNVNLVPCSRCTSALFCRGQCEDNRHHRIQCELQIVHDESLNDLQMQLVRSLLMAISEFPSVESLMTFVEQAVASDPTEIPESLLDNKSKYRAFLKLSFDRKTTVKETFPTQICFVYKTFTNHPATKQKFATKKYRRFLMHLIGHHLCVVQCNTGALMYNPESPFNISQGMMENLSILVNYINHSCFPNVCIISSDEFNICVTLRPIHTGDQLFVSYFRNDSLQLKHSTADRQTFLRDICDFDCDCEKCVTSTTAPQELVNELKMDLRYQYVRKGGNKMNCCTLYGHDTRVLTLCSCSKNLSRDSKLMLEKCVPLMDKYGQMNYAPELDLVVRSLESALQCDLGD